MTKPSKRRMRSQHGKKISYPTLAAAQVAAAKMAKRKEQQGNPIVTFLRAYGCPCGKFHIGKTRDIDWSKVSSGRALA